MQKESEHVKGLICSCVEVGVELDTRWLTDQQKVHTLGLLSCRIYLHGLCTILSKRQQFLYFNW